jgi:hypothetical protein
MLNKTDIEQLKEKGISENAVLKQIERFAKGFEQLNVIKPATPNDGIKILNYRQKKEYSELFDNSVKNGLSVMKFVPASGAATRMFKDLFQYFDNPVELDELSVNHSIMQFMEQLPKFAFYPLLQEVFSNYNLDDLNTRKLKIAEIITETLYNKSLSYEKLPKGLIHFHKYLNNIIRTAMEEHLVEGSYYAKNHDNIVKIHFTVSPEHYELFKSKLDDKKTEIEKIYKTKLDVDFSFQKSYTDTIAVTPDNVPFRDKEGNLVFRPGGHGALIENLNEQNADMIFIKNIDNVSSEHLIDDTVKYKKNIGGLLISLQKTIFEFLKELDIEINENLIKKIEKFIRNELFVQLPELYLKLSLTQKAEYLRKYLNRPVRVCGMVRNEGEPGGGPFWVREKNGQETLQILESSQLDLNNPLQTKQLKNATHFNPVDLVCATKDYKGNKFNITEFTDPQTGFISEKSINGQPIKALELPGLWNGAMANWISLFVEVPITTFNPVKTVNDLLRIQHQPK